MDAYCKDKKKDLLLLGYTTINGIFSDHRISEMEKKATGTEKNSEMETIFDPVLVDAPHFMKTYTEFFKTSFQEHMSNGDALPLDSRHWTRILNRSLKKTKRMGNETAAVFSRHVLVSWRAWRL